MERTAAQEFLINASREAAHVMPVLRAPARSDSVSDNVCPVHIYKGAYGRCSTVFNKGLDGFYLPTHVSVGYGENNGGVYQQTHSESVTVDRMDPECLNFVIESANGVVQSKSLRGNEIERIQMIRESAEDMGFLTTMFGIRSPHRPVPFLRAKHFAEIPSLLECPDKKLIYSARLAIR
jgi:hypothetical protein